MLTQRMSETVSIVGAGRVGRALGRRLHELGWRVGGVTGRSISTARAAVRAIGAGQPSAAPDSPGPEFKSRSDHHAGRRHRRRGENLAQLGGKEWSGKVVLHTSGTLDSSVLRPLAALGAATGSMHPMQTFSSQNFPDLAKCIFGIEGAPAAMQVARKMIHQMGGVAVRLSGANKAAYHAAGSFACVYVLALMETATRLLMTQGFKRRQAMRALLPLTRQTLDNFESVGPLAAWTGPWRRGDFSTIERHVKALGGIRARISGGLQDAFAPDGRSACRAACRHAQATRPDLRRGSSSEKEMTMDVAPAFRRASVRRQSARLKAGATQRRIRRCLIFIHRGLLDSTEHSNRKHDAAERPARGGFAGPHRAGGHGRGLLQHRVSHRAARPQRLRASVRAHDVSGLGQRREDGAHQADQFFGRRAERLDAL